MFLRQRLRGSRLQDEVTAARLDRREVTHHLDCIAEPLLSRDEELASGELFAAP
jgi:hypothetical protein